jgi:hypothetical protein
VKALTLSFKELANSGHVTVLRVDGSQSGVRVVLDVAVQQASPRQYSGRTPPTAASDPSAAGFFNLVS